MKPLKTFWNKLFIPLIAVAILGGAVYLLLQYIIIDIYMLLQSVTWQHIVIAALGFLFFAFNELEDESCRSNWKHSKHFLNTNLSWLNKWKSNAGRVIKNTKKHWYYFGINPPYIERFYLSSTALVFLTDGEHLFQFLKKRSIDAAFLVVGWQYMVAWMIGVILFSFIKEKFLKSIN